MRHYINCRAGSEATNRVSEERRERRREVNQQRIRLIRQQEVMTTVLKASDWLNGQLSGVMQLDSCEDLCMEYHVCTSYKPYTCALHEWI